MLKSIEAGGLLDPRTGLLAGAAFDRDFSTAVANTLSHGGGLSVARFAFDPAHPRAQLDGARILSRLMRQMDFGAARDDGSVLVVFAETDLRTAHMIARRLSSVMRQTSHGKRDTRAEPDVRAIRETAKAQRRKGKRKEFKTRNSILLCVPLCVFASLRFLPRSEGA